MPSIVKRPVLRLARTLVGVQHVVAGVAVERGIEIDEIHRLTVPLAHPVETVTEVQVAVLWTPVVRKQRPASHLPLTRHRGLAIVGAEPGGSTNVPHSKRL